MRLMSPHFGPSSIQPQARNAPQFSQSRTRPLGATRNYAPSLIHSHVTLFFAPPPTGSGACRLTSPRVRTNSRPAMYSPLQLSQSCTHRPCSAIETSLIPRFSLSILLLRAPADRGRRLGQARSAEGPKAGSGPGPGGGACQFSGRYKPYSTLLSGSVCKTRSVMIVAPRRRYKL